MLFDVPQASLQLERFPEPEVNLRAWNGADAYLLEWLAEHRVIGRGPCCVVNDSFGALALSLVASGETAVVSWSDSLVAHEGGRANAIRNNMAVDAVDWVPSTEPPVPAPPARTFGLVVVRVPKSLERLQQQLRQLAPLVGSETLVVAGGMTKQVHTSTIRCFEDVIGPTTTSLARKKARLLHVEPATVASPATAASPPGAPQKMFTAPSGLTFFADPALFSHTRIDPASAALLDAARPLVESDDIVDVIDLGCGSGVIGLTLLQHRPDLVLTFTDESYLAVATSRASFEYNANAGTLGSAPDRHTFLVDDCGSTIPAATADLVCINPPFHDATARTTAIAKRMFANAARILRPGGSVVVVGNRHLNHHTTLRRWFAKPTVLASDRRFVVLRARTRWL